MAPPVITTITPSEGRTLGKTFVVIDGTGFNDEASGGTVRVLFDGVESPRYGVVSDTKVIAQTPGGNPGLIDVTVENIGPGGAPIEPTTEVDGFEYKRADISTPRDFSNHPCLALVIKSVIREFRRTIFDRVFHDLHPEYADVASAAAEEEKQSAPPHLKIVGPVVQIDRFYSFNGNQNVQTTPAPGLFDEYNQPVTVMAEFQHIGVGRTNSEAANIHREVERWFNANATLIVPHDGVDPANGFNEYDIMPIWEQRASFGDRMTREGVAQFTGAFVVRGIHIANDKVFEGADTTDEVTVVVEPEP